MPTGNTNTTSTYFPVDLQAKSFAAAICRLMPNGSAPLFGMTAMLKSETAVQTEHGYFSKTMIFPAVTMTVAAIAGDTTFTVNSTTNMRPGMMLRAQSTGEVVIVNTIPSGTTITVTRGVGTVVAGAIAINIPLYQIGNAFEEGSARPTPLSITPVRITNLTQIFRDAWGITGTAEAVEVIAGGGTLAENKMDCTAFHATAIESALLFGQKSSGTRNGQPFRTMDGLLNHVNTLSFYPAGTVSPNVYVAGGTTNWTQLENFLDPCFNQTTDPKTGNQRVMFVGSAAMKVINNIGRLNAQYQVMTETTAYGLQFGSFRTTRGKFNMVEHPLLNSNPDWSRYCIVVDLPTFNVAYLGNRKTMKQDILDSEGIDAKGGVLTTELTCVVKNPPANAWIQNLTAAAAG
ncbi:MAG: SU10 major capsid protein [Waterburya sp.]